MPFRWLTHSVIKLGSLEKTWWAKKQIISPPGLFRPEYNLLCVAYTLGPPRPRVDLWGGNPWLAIICLECLRDHLQAETGTWNARETEEDGQ